MIPFILFIKNAHARIHMVYYVMWYNILLFRPQIYVWIRSYACIKQKKGEN